MKSKKKSGIYRLCRFNGLLCLVGISLTWFSFVATLPFVVWRNPGQAVLMVLLLPILSPGALLAVWMFFRAEQIAEMHDSVMREAAKGTTPFWTKGVVAMLIVLVVLCLLSSLIFVLYDFEWAMAIAGYSGLMCVAFLVRGLIYTFWDRKRSRD